MPALLVTVVDEQDPIQVGKQVVYKIFVKNQGNTTDKNLYVNVELAVENALAIGHEIAIRNRPNDTT